jgi:hypothetical protein
MEYVQGLEVYTQHHEENQNRNCLTEDWTLLLNREEF